MKPLILATMIALETLSFSSAAMAGSRSDGGTCSIQTSEGGWTIKEFLRAGFVDLITPEKPGEKILAKSPIKILNSYKNAVARLMDWQKDSPQVVNKLIEAIGNVDIQTVSEEFQPITRGCRDTGNHPVAMYSEQYGQVVISVPVFNRLSTKAQELVFLKESSRVMEEFWLLRSDENTMEMGLSALTFAIQFSQPKENQNQLVRIMNDNHIYFNEYGEFDNKNYEIFARLNADFKSLCRQKWIAYDCSQLVFPPLTGDFLNFEIVRRKANQAETNINEFVLKLVQAKTPGNRDKINSLISKIGELKERMLEAVVNYFANSSELVNHLKYHPVR